MKLIPNPNPLRRRYLARDKNSELMPNPNLFRRIRDARDAQHMLVAYFVVIPASSRRPPKYKRT